MPSLIITLRQPDGTEQPDDPIALAQNQLATLFTLSDTDQGRLRDANGLDAGYWIWVSD